MNKIDVHEYEKEVSCDYRNETYSVRDNGAIFRHSRIESRLRPLDDKWTFGNPNKQRGYMNISSEPVHRIVATAFHGNAPTDKHIVDHIDTNRRNNRPENLRWITRLDNLLLNPITRKRIIHSYGSLDNFFANPSTPIHTISDKNFGWMRTVSKEEAENSKESLLKWAEEETLPVGGELGEWIYRQKNDRVHFGKTENNFIDSLTPIAVQLNWKTPNEFPLCPKTIGKETMEIYEKKLTKGKILALNKYGKSDIEEFEFINEKKELLVLTRSDNPIKPFAIARIYTNNDRIIHASEGSFFTKNGALKEFNLLQGKDCEGGQTIDDFA